MTLASALKVRVDALVDAPPEDLNEIFATFGVGTRAAVSRGSRGGAPDCLGLTIGQNACSIRVGLA